MKDILTSTEAEEELQLVRNFVKWWEKKRLLFNIIIFLAGVLPFIINYNQYESISPFLLIPMVIYGIILNICYCAGWGLGIIIWNYTGRIKGIESTKWLFFILGTVATALFTFAAAFATTQLPYY